MANNDLAADSAAILVVLPRLQYRLRAQSFAIQRLSAALVRIRRMARIFAPHVADRVGELVFAKESALVELAVAIDRGELPTIISLKQPAEPVAEMLEMAAVIPLQRVAEPSNHQRLQQYLGSGMAQKHLGELDEATRELRSFLVDHFSVDELLEVTGSALWKDPDAIPGRF